MLKGVSKNKCLAKSLGKFQGSRSLYRNSARSRLGVLTSKSDHKRLRRVRKKKKLWTNRDQLESLSYFGHCAHLLFITCNLVA